MLDYDAISIGDRAACRRAQGVRLVPTSLRAAKDMVRVTVRTSLGGPNSFPVFRLRGRLLAALCEVQAVTQPSVTCVIASAYQTVLSVHGAKRLVKP